MLTRGSRCSKMPCESCAVQFSVFRRKQVCCECERYYCNACLRREGAYILCAACKVLSTRPLLRQSIVHLKVRDLQCFLQRQNVSTRGCVEKEELVSLCVSHVNSAAYRRRGPRARSSPFSSLKGFTNNLNVLINNAFEIRNNAQPQPAPPPHSNCHNASHAHTPRPAPAPAAPPAVPRERFTTTPGGERDIEVPVPAPAPEAGSPSSEGARVDSADCFEIEDLDDSGWEFVTRPADPLPDDSEVLIAESESQERESSALSPSAGAGAGAGRVRLPRAPARPRRGQPTRRAHAPTTGCRHRSVEPRGAGPHPGAVGAGGAQRAPAEGAAGEEPSGLHRLPRADRAAAAGRAAVDGPHRLQGRAGQAAAGGVLQDLHGGAAGVRAAGVRAHRGVHGVLAAAGRVPHLSAVRRARRALLPLLRPARPRPPETTRDHPTPPDTEQHRPTRASHYHNVEHT